MSSTLLLNTCMHFKLSIFMLFDIFFATPKIPVTCPLLWKGRGYPTPGIFRCRLCINLDDQTSTITYIFLLASTPISWCCWKQNLISWLSCEFEYRSLAHCREVVWNRRLLHELGLDMNAFATIMYDN